METRRIGNNSKIVPEMRAEKLTLPQMKQIYETWMKTDFPPEEIKPFSVIKAMWERGCYQAYGFYEMVQVTGKNEAHFDGTENLCAYAFLLCNEKEQVLLLDYFAVISEKRGSGYGSRALPLLRDKCAHWGMMVIEVEDDELDSIDEKTRVTRRRRISFYSAAGCQMTSTRSRVWGVDYRIMIMPLADAGVGERIAEKVTALYGGMYHAEAMKKHFAITAV